MYFDEISTNDWDLVYALQLYLQSYPFETAMDKLKKDLDVVVNNRPNVKESSRHRAKEILEDWNVIMLIRFD